MSPRIKERSFTAESVNIPDSKKQMTQILLSPIPLEEMEGMMKRIMRESLSEIAVQPSTEDLSELITRKQAAKMLNLSLPTLREYTVRGLLPSYQMGARVLYKKVEVLECLTKQKTKKHAA